MRAARRFVTLALGLTFSLLVQTRPARAYVRARSPDGQFNLIWPDPHQTMIVYTGSSMVSPDDFVGAASEAAAAWSAPNVDTSVALTIASSPDQPKGAVFDHQNTISFRTSTWTAPAYPPSALALTTVWTKDGRIVETDTEINAVDPRFHWAVLPDDPAVATLSGDQDLQNALTHELGHALGLAHPCFLGGAPSPLPSDNFGEPVPSCSDPTLSDDVRAATMFPSATAGSIGERHLSADELMALQDLYPAGHAPVVEGPVPEQPAGGCAVATPPPSGEAALLMGGLVFFAVRRRPRATRSRRPGT